MITPVARFQRRPRARKKSPRKNNSSTTGVQIATRKKMANAVNALGFVGRNPVFDGDGSLEINTQTIPPSAESTIATNPPTKPHARSIGRSSRPKSKRRLRWPFQYVATTGQPRNPGQPHTMLIVSAPRLSSVSDESDPTPVAIRMIDATIPPTIQRARPIKTSPSPQPMIEPCRASEVGGGGSGGGVVGGCACGGSGGSEGKVMKVPEPMLATPDPDD